MRCDDLPVRSVSPMSSQRLPGYCPKEDAEELSILTAPKKPPIPNRKGGKPKGHCEIRMAWRNRIAQHIQSNATELKPATSATISKALKRHIGLVNEDLKWMRETGAVHFRKIAYAIGYWI